MSYFKFIKKLIRVKRVPIYPLSPFMCNLFWCQHFEPQWYICFTSEAMLVDRHVPKPTVSFRYWTAQEFWTNAQWLYPLLERYPL